MKILVEKKYKKSKELLVIPLIEGEKYTSDFQKYDFLEQKIKDFEKSNAKFYISQGEDAICFLKTEKGLSSKKIAAKIAKILKTHEIENAEIFLTKNLQKEMHKVLEGLLLVQYDLAKYKTKSKSKSKKDEKAKYELKTIKFINPKCSTDYKSDIKDTLTLVEATELVKDLVNGPANYIDANYFAKEARKIAKENGYKIAVLGDKELKKMNWGGLLAVNQGTDKAAKVVVIEYNGGKKSDPKIALVGKGILFDAGGYNIKPTGYMETMMQDMAGAATVLGVFYTLKKLKIKKNVVAIMPLAENLINGSAYRPSDIITMLSGNTVEITNTDAEGRLILADGITYAKKIKSDKIITIATLTGAVQVALGDRFTGLMSNDTILKKIILKAGEISDELAWELPMHDDYRKAMDSEIADYKNADTRRFGPGTITAASFLEKFVGDEAWAHLDIAATAFTSNPEEHQTKGATAHSMQLLLETIKQI